MENISLRSTWKIKQARSCLITFVFGECIFYSAGQRYANIAMLSRDIIINVSTLSMISHVPCLHGEATSNKAYIGYQEGPIIMDFISDLARSPSTW